MNYFLQSVNNRWARLVYQIIIIGTTGSPVINGYVENKFWLMLFTFLAVLFIATFKVPVTPKNKKAVYAVVLYFVVLLVYLFIRWG